MSWHMRRTDLCHFREPSVVVADGRDNVATVLLDQASEESGTGIDVVGLKRTMQ